MKLFGNDSTKRLRRMLEAIRTRDFTLQYSTEKLYRKKQCKRDLQKWLGLPESDAPMLTLITRLVAPKGVGIIMEMMDEHVPFLQTLFSPATTMAKLCSPKTLVEHMREAPEKGAGACMIRRSTEHLLDVLAAVVGGLHL